jgi:hypothetical protein
MKDNNIIRDRPAGRHQAAHVGPDALVRAGERNSPG